MKHEECNGEWPCCLNGGACSIEAELLTMRVAAGRVKSSLWPIWLLSRTGIAETRKACDALGGYRAARELFQMESGL